MGAKNDSSLQPDAVRLICNKCSQPILPGNNFAAESEAGCHGSCLQREIHQEMLNSKAHELWLQAYTLFCATLHTKIAEATIVPLASEYQGQYNPKKYLDFLRRAIALIPDLPLPEATRIRLTEQVTAIRDQIRGMLSAGAN